MPVVAISHCVLRMGSSCPIQYRREFFLAWAKRIDIPVPQEPVAAAEARGVQVAEQPGYRSRIRYSDADYFRLPEKDERAARTSNDRPVPTPEQIESVLEHCPTATVLDRRNRVMIAFTWLTGVRDGALISPKLEHVDLAQQRVNQDPREVDIIKALGVLAGLLRGEQLTSGHGANFCSGAMRQA